MDALKCIIEVSPKKDSSFVLGLINFLGLIVFFEKEPKPLISTLLSHATVLIISCSFKSMPSIIISSFKDGNFLDKWIAKSDLLKFCT